MVEYKATPARRIVNPGVVFGDREPLTIESMTGLGKRLGDCDYDDIRFLVEYADRQQCLFELLESMLDKYKAPPTVKIAEALRLMLAEDRAVLEAAGATMAEMEEVVDDAHGQGVDDPRGRPSS